MATKCPHCNKKVDQLFVASSLIDNETFRLSACCTTCIIKWIRSECNELSFDVLTIKQATEAN
jgi:hypothetical protein